MSQTKPKSRQTARADEPGEELKQALNRAGGYLARRPHSLHELHAKLGRSFDDEVVRAALKRLQQLDLIDDAGMAIQWVEERASKRGRQALAEELRAKGIGEDDIAFALSRLDAGEEEARARALAERLYPKVARKPLARQGPNLAAMLARRGFSPEVAEAATRAVLPPEGWD